MFCIPIQYILIMSILDDLDRRLLSLLRANSRESVVNLARRLGVTRATVDSRLKRLVDSGVIVGLSVRGRDPAAASGVRAIMLTGVAGGNTRDVIRSRRGATQFAALHTSNGRWDLVAEVSCDSLTPFDETL